MLPIQTPKAQPCDKCAEALQSAFAEFDRWAIECEKRYSTAAALARRAASNRVYLARLDAIDCRFHACANSAKQ